jgi:hypothetical protein
MKYVLGAGAFAFAVMVAGSALAQTTPPAPAPQATASRCAAVSTASPGSLPDGATADADAMNAGNTTFTAWATAERATLECRRAEIADLRATLEARTGEFNGAAERLNTSIATWQAEVDEYNARAPQRRRGR